jgi:hypothetical protein
VAAGVQITIDCADPDRLARFWAAVLGYVVQPPPEGFASWDEFLAAQGVPAKERNDASAAVDPDGRGPRLFFQRVPEAKTVKNRVHLDVGVSGGLDVPLEERRRRVDEAADRVAAAGATKIRPVEDRFATYWWVMADPEGNEFCLH